MTANGWFQIIFFLLVILTITKPLGVFMARVFNREKTFLDFAVRPIERLMYRICGIREEQEMHWVEYGTAMLLFSGFSMLLLFGIERAQQWLGFNPQNLANVAPDLAWNTAASFTTNTNWQSYIPETTMSYLTQMAGLAYHNFASAAVGIALAIALIRGIARRESKTIGNFWVDLTRCFLWVLLPACLLISLVFVSQGVVQDLKPYASVQLIDPQTVQTSGADGKTTTQTVTQQRIALGPTASQEAIKMLGTNGGGFFNANSAHPFENPTPFTNFLQMVLIFAIPAGLTYTLGRMTGAPRHGWAIWGAMAALFLAGVSAAYAAEARGNPQFSGVDQASSDLHSGGNMEGKEVRFGIANSALFATVTTDASCGAVNSMHDSFTPLGGMMPLLNIMLGEVIFGGVGSGLYGMLVFVILAVFIAGLMVGRTPEYLGKKIEAFDVKMAMLSVLASSTTILLFAAVAMVTKPGLAGITNPGPHGLSQILYAYTSSVGNNGSAFGGVNANTLWFNTSTGIATLLGRFFVVIPILAIAGNLAAKRTAPASAGTFPVTGTLFATLLVSTISHRRRADVFPGPESRTNSRALAHARRKGFLRTPVDHSSQAKPQPLADKKIVVRAIVDSFTKLSPRTMVKNPVMFVVEVGALLTTIELIADTLRHAGQFGFGLQITLWLWFTVLFANFAEAMAEGRGKAQADTLRKARAETEAHILRANGSIDMIASSKLRTGDVVVVVAGEFIPGDGEAIEGVASVDESAITGESAPVIRESGGDRSAVTGGTRVLSDSINVRITSNPGETFLDRMIRLVEGASRQKTPNEIALNILLAGLTIIFLLAVVTLQPFAIYSGAPQSIFVLVSLLVCLIPTTIGGLLSAIGIAGIDRMIQRNVIAMSGRAVEASGDVDVLLLDKTGTITLGNRQATMLFASPNIAEADLANAAQLASLADETPEGRSIVVLVKEKYGLRGRELSQLSPVFIPFSAQTRMSGVDLDGVQIRKGAPEAIAKHVAERGNKVPSEIQQNLTDIANGGGTPLLVAENGRVLGVIALTDIVKGGMRERFDHLRAMGIRTMMITGDNPLTAAAIARQAGVDDFLAEARPEDKMALIKREQAKGKLVAMTGDGTNDAPALAQADVGVAMNTGTQAAKEAGNMVDLDSNPTKLIEIVEIGKQLLITRGALTTFSVANDVAKYFAIIPAMFARAFPQLNVLNVMRLATPQSAILSAVIFNALIIIALIPLALRGVRYRPVGAAALLRQNLLVYGLGGVIAPFIGIKLIDLLITYLRFA